MFQERATRRLARPFVQLVRDVARHIEPFAISRHGQTRRNLATLPAACPSDVRHRPAPTGLLTTVWLIPGTPDGCHRRLRDNASSIRRKGETCEADLRTGGWSGCRTCLSCLFSVASVLSAGSSGSIGFRACRPGFGHVCDNETACTIWPETGEQNQTFDLPAVASSFPSGLNASTCGASLATQLVVRRA